MDELWKSDPQQAISLIAVRSLLFNTTNGSLYEALSTEVDGTPFAYILYAQLL